ncbi:hypothetical protein PSTT_15914, partial [Puccinia striiformis]
RKKLKRCSRHENKIIVENIYIQEEDAKLEWRLDYQILINVRVVVPGVVWGLPSRQLQPRTNQNMDLSAYEPIPSSSISRINSRPPAIANKLIPHTQLDTQTCSLLGPFSILIQAIMALIILASLLYKRHREKPKRKYRIWTADVSKQVLGQAFVHMLNIFISDSMASLPSKGNPCALYFMNIFIDTTIGVFVLFLALNFITLLVCKTLKKTSTNLGLSSGIYPDPFIKSWMKQLSIYFIGLIILKLFVLGLFWLGGSALIKFGNSIIEAISLDPKIQILVVVMIGPTILNVLQFLLIDSFININRIRILIIKAKATEDSK